jgi:opacity protein-like surface antigen
VKEAVPRFLRQVQNLFIGERKQMRRLILVAIGAIGLSLFSIPSFAQEVIYPKVEVFGGFSMYRAGSTFMGWQASANANVTHHLAIVGDFGGQYKTLPGTTVLGVTIPGLSLNSYQFLFGPRVVFRKSRVTPFVHALFGGIRSGIGSTTILGITTPAVSATGLGMGIGGGLDINISNRLALRVPQFDWTPMHIAGTTVLGVTVPGRWASNQVRIGIGLVVKAGE